MDVKAMLIIAYTNLVSGKIMLELNGKIYSAREGKGKSPPFSGVHRVTRTYVQIP